MSEQPDGASPAADVSPAGLAPDSDPKALRRVARWVAIEVFLYVVIALVLIFLALRRGRLSDAILVTITVFITTPLILGYRQQALARLRGERKTPAETTPEPAADEGSTAGDGGDPPAAGG